jgi:transcriptional regulator with XRE-family HTH domain
MNRNAPNNRDGGKVGLDGVSIGERLREERERKGWSARMLGQRSGVSHAYISHLEAGQYARPGIERLGRLAEALGVPLSALTGRMEGDPALEQIQVNLKAIRKLDPEALDRLAEIILAVKEKAERERRAER